MGEEGGGNIQNMLNYMNTPYFPSFTARNSTIFNSNSLIKTSLSFKMFKFTSYNKVGLH